VIHKDFRPAWNIYVSPMEDYVIFAAMHEGGFGDLDLYVSFKTQNNKWGTPINMGDKINTKTRERFPMVSPDGKYFFFMRHTPGQDFFWISTDIFVDLKKKSEQTVDFKKNMILVEGGSFPKGESQKKRSVDSFLISKYEVTQKEYIAVMNTNPSLRYGLDHPVEKISWYDATKYCNTLSKSEGLTPCYSGHKDNIVCNFEANGYRLPTETEWEYAAIGGKHHTNQSTANAPSDTLDAYVWHYGNSNNNSHPVGEKLANPLGLHDMGGNVWEWCWNSYQPNPTGNANGKNREKVVRGGGWPDDVDLCRSDFQYSAHPNRLAYCIGFRVVRSL
ncbi:SUMF1/EgtB/PvdO family nonheme iron enzyme, partial [bacterium]|nr:SUMF1/EgtB/PvdO family nonheme iron enzyme [bacterium]